MYGRPTGGTSAGNRRVFTGLPKSIGFGVAWLGTFAWFNIVGGLFSLLAGLGAGALGSVFGSDACVGSGCDNASNTLHTSAALISIAALATAGLGVFVLVSVVQMAFGDQRAVQRGFIGAMAICVTALAVWAGFNEPGFGLFTAFVLAGFAIVGFGPFLTTSGKTFFRDAQHQPNSGDRGEHPGAAGEGREGAAGRLTSPASDD